MAGNPVIAADGGVQRTIPDTEGTFAVGPDDLANTVTGARDMRGKWVYVWGGGSIIRAAAGTGVPTSATAVTEFFVDPLNPTVITVTGVVKYAYDAAI